MQLEGENLIQEEKLPIEKFIDKIISEVPIQNNITELSPTLDYLRYLMKKQENKELQKKLLNYIITKNNFNCPVEIILETKNLMTKYNLEDVTEIIDNDQIRTQFIDIINKEEKRLNNSNINFWLDTENRDGSVLNQLCLFLNENKGATLEGMLLKLNLLKEERSKLNDFCYLCGIPEEIAQELKKINLNYLNYQTKLTLPQFLEKNPIAQELFNKEAIDVISQSKNFSNATSKNCDNQHFLFRTKKDPWNDFKLMIGIDAVKTNPKKTRFFATIGLIGSMASITATVLTLLFYKTMSHIKFFQIIRAFAIGGSPYLLIFTAIFALISIIAIARATNAEKNINKIRQTIAEKNKEYREKQFEKLSKELNKNFVYEHKAENEKQNQHFNKQTSTKKPENDEGDKLIQQNNQYKRATYNSMDQYQQLKNDESVKEIQNKQIPNQLIKSQQQQVCGQKA